MVGAHVTHVTDLCLEFHLNSNRRARETPDPQGRFSGGAAGSVLWDPGAAAFEYGRCQDEICVGAEIQSDTQRWRVHKTRTGTRRVITEEEGCGMLRGRAELSHLD
ncbi:hypothetical protein AAFF_G00265930 [Aldrovandia affinis]|uniref:Uncharacterized protein n=1 Tax=Aldrovandia affinis TaxID=143900 RepID=A0AAD7RBG5_9TELE|nr:hypothetical protein AAFF_G00265930 [Aldrovandia affinis]